MGQSPDTWFSLLRVRAELRAPLSFLVLAGRYTAKAVTEMLHLNIRSPGSPSLWEEEGCGAGALTPGLSPGSGRGGRGLGSESRVGAGSRDAWGVWDWGRAGG